MNSGNGYYGGLQFSLATWKNVGGVGYPHQASKAEQIKRGKDFAAFFSEAPALHPNASKITGVICGVRIEEIEDPLMRNIRYLDKLVDELAKGRAMEKILRK